jgi:hypothetical protein
MGFKTSRVRWPEWAVATSALALLLIMLGPSWFTLSQQSGGTRATTPASAGAGQAIHPTIATINYSINGWRGLVHAHWLLLITILLGFALLVAQATRRAPGVPVSIAVFVTILAGASAIWLFVRVAIDPPGGRNLGGWLALICSTALTGSAWKSLRTEGIAPEDERHDIPTVRLGDLPPSADPP